MWRRVRFWLLVVVGGMLVSSCNNSCGGSPPLGKNPYPAHKTQTPTTPTGGPSGVTWSISPIDAAFSQDCFCTDYEIKIAGHNLVSSNDKFRVTWTIKQTLVDPPGDPDPETPGSGAAVDPGCDNNGNGTTKPVVDDVSGLLSAADSFIWYHPDPSSAPPGTSAGVYHCDHTKQGPHGHQGIITVRVTHGAQTCVASYDGTHSGASSDADQPGNPVCTRN